MSTITTGYVLDVLNDVLALLEIDPALCTELLSERFLLAARVDGEGTEAERVGVLDSKVAKSSSCTGDDDPLTGAEVGFLDRTVDSHASAKDRASILERQVVGDGSDVLGVALDVLAKGTVDAVAGALGAFGAVGLVAKTAHFALEAGIGDPLDTNTVADFDILVCVRAELDYDTSAFVCKERHNGVKSCTQAMKRHVCTHDHRQGARPSSGACSGRASLQAWRGL